MSSLAAAPWGGLQITASAPSLPARQGCTHMNQTFCRRGHRRGLGGCGGSLRPESQGHLTSRGSLPFPRGPPGWEQLRGAARNRLHLASGVSFRPSEPGGLSGNQLARREWEEAAQTGEPRWGLPNTHPRPPSRPGPGSSQLPWGAPLPWHASLSAGAARSLGAAGGWGEPPQQPRGMGGALGSIRCTAVPSLPPPTPQSLSPTNQFDSAQQAGLQFSNYAAW